jgi:hypothetical protein
MPLSDIVVVSIVNSTGGVTQAGFGEACLLTCEASWSERIRRYSSAAAVASDFPTATGPTYLAAAEYFGQTPASTNRQRGRRALKPTQRWKISVASITAGANYEMRVGADDITVVDAGTFAVNDAIIVSLNAAIQAAPSYGTNGFASTIAGSPGATYVYLTASVAGNWVAVETYTPALISVEQNQADAGIATDLNAIATEDNSWYGLITTFNSHAEVDAAQVWVDAYKKLYTPQVTDTPCENDALAGATDVAASIKTAGSERVGCIYKRAPDDFADAGWMGAMFPLDPGSETWAGKAIVGANADTFTATQQTNLNNKYCSFYYSVAGRNLTSIGNNVGGKVGSGKFIDSTRFIDWLTARLQERIFLAIANSKKLPFTDAGIAVIEAIVRATLQDGVAAGGLDPDPASIVVIFPKAADVSDADKAARHLTGSFTAVGAGAIHGVTLSGTITL